jgi:hypothetical protein
MDPTAARDLFAAQLVEAELFKNVFRRGISEFDVSQESGQAQSVKRDFNERPGSLRGKPLSPDGVAQNSTQDEPPSHRGSA